MIKLSFIVPIYKVEQYLRKCVDSLLCQDYDDYEIILVDDGGTDGCPVICDEYAAKYDQIRVVHRENGGLSAARNSGIEIAQGEYLCFVDSDDYWEPNVLGELMAQIERDHLEVLRFRWQNVRESGETFMPYKEANFVDFSDIPLSGIDYLNQRMGIQCYAWSFIVRAEMARVERFTEGILFEDTDWTPRMLVKANRVAGTSLMVYNYLWRENGITLSQSPTKLRQEVENKLQLIKKLNSWGQSDWYRVMISALVVSVCNILGRELYQERYAYLNLLNKLDVLPISVHHLNTRMRRKANIINYSPQIAVWLLHCMHK